MAATPNPPEDPGAQTPPPGNPPVPVNIEDEMRRSFLDYSMSVIISRALPDVRDGLKPSQRRVLLTFNDLNLTFERPYRKCAKISGDVSGNYHPHGEAVVYPSLVRLAQPFSMRYPLVDGQGNFGSVDGDPPAAMRYTEARLSRIAAEIMADLGRDTVDFVPNYDNTREEPVVLPTRIPNLVINGSTGIAVGMATNIPPHNLGEVVEALVLLARRPEASVEEVMEKLPAPDFPTAAILCGEDGVRNAYRTGRGLIILRARAKVETVRSGRRAIVVTEIPYMLNKASMIEKIAELVRDGKIQDVSDIRDESDRRGMRVVIELKKEANEEVVLNNLFKLSPMQSTFGVNMLALVNNRPVTLNIAQMLNHFLDFRRVVVRRRAAYALRHAAARAPILERTSNAKSSEAASPPSTSAATTGARGLQEGGVSVEEVAAMAASMVNVWTALGSVGPREGCMQFSRGSHHLGLVHHSKPAPGDTWLRIPEEVRASHCSADSDRVVDVVVEPGDIVLFHQYMLHGSELPNLSGRLRWAL